MLERADCSKPIELDYGLIIGKVKVFFDKPPGARVGTPGLASLGVTLK